jgi:hypothetical protein
MRFLRGGVVAEAEVGGLHKVGVTEQVVVPPLVVSGSAAAILYSAFDQSRCIRTSPSCCASSERRAFVAFGMFSLVFGCDLDDRAANGRMPLRLRPSGPTGNLNSDFASVRNFRLLCGGIMSSLVWGQSSNAKLDQMIAAGKSQRELAQYLFETHGCKSRVGPGNFAPSRSQSRTWSG